MDEPIPVESVFLNPDLYHDKVIYVSGQFVAIYLGQFLCPLGATLEAEPDPAAAKIELDHPDLEQRCFDTVGAWVGTHIYYNDPATIRGRFLAHPIPKLTELTIFAIHRDGETYYVGLT